MICSAFRRRWGSQAVAGASTVVAVALGAVLAVAGFAVPAWAQRPVGDVTGGDVQLVRIAITSPVAVGERADAQNLGELFQKVVMADLAFSGLFDPIAPGGFPEPPSPDPSKIDYPKWLAAGAMGVTKGSYRIEGDRVVWDIRLFNIGEGREARKLGGSAPMASTRAIAHRCAEEILKYYTGGAVKPIFSTEIVVTRKFKGTRELWLMDYDGGNPRQITRTGSINMLPAWTPDGRSLFHTSFINGKADLYRLDLESLASTLISARRGLNTSPAVSPDGRTLAVTLTIDDNAEIYAMDLNGQNIRRLTRSDDIDTDATWSPDGKRIAFVSDVTGSPQIYIMPATGGTPQRVTIEGNYNTTPRWNPDPDNPTLVYVARDEYRNFDLCITSVAEGPDFGRCKRLTQNQGKSNEDPSWSPDGRFIAFSSDRAGGRYHTFIMDKDGNRQTQITFGEGEYKSPAWRPFRQR